jgi:hypothetical protein
MERKCHIGGRAAWGLSTNASRGAGFNEDHPSLDQVKSSMSAVLAPRLNKERLAVPVRESR